MIKLENQAKCYQEIIEITKDYIGSDLEAERFVSRQIKLHLKKSPNDLKRNDIPMLAIRIRSGLLVLTKDRKVVEELFRKIVTLGDCA